MSPAAIDWGAVKARLREREEALRETLSENSDRLKIVFRERAVQLARAQNTQTSTAGTPALVFRLGEERHAIALSELLEVIPFRDCTPVPGSAPGFCGVIHLRGELRPVLDLARILAVATAATSGVVLILRRKAAFKVDSVEDLRDVRNDEGGALTLLNVERVLARQ